MKKFAKILLPIVTGIFSSIMGIYYYLEFSGLGFPDGHLTRLGEFRKIYYPIYSIISLTLVFYSIYLTKSRSQPFLKLKYYILLVAVVATLFWSIDYHYSRILDDGGGG